MPHGKCSVWGREVRFKSYAILAACIALCLALTPDGRSQDTRLQPYYWPHRTVGIPVDVDKISKLEQKPSELQLYYWVGGTLQKGAKLPLNNMQQLDGGKRGFLFTAERDGDFEFTVQFIYPDNSTSPRTDDLSPQQRIVIDATPPATRLAPSANGVSWQITDDNLDPRSVQLQCKWPTQQEWTNVTERDFRPIDQFAWKLQPGKVLDVRVKSADRAGNEGVSQIVRIPPDTATAVGLPKGAGEWPVGNLPQARIDYVNTLKFDVDYTIQKMGRSGVQAAHLFVLKSQGNWEKVKKFDVQLRPADKDTSLSLPYEAKDEGTYGFYVIPESGAGKKSDDPRKEDPPMVYVVVDTTPPYVRINGVSVKPGGTRGPLVEITWEAADPNLMPQPISLEWSLDKSATRWNEVKYRLTNNLTKTTGRYVWEVPDENLWKFYLRIRAVDMATNTGEHIWSKKDADGKDKPAEVIVDLENPSAIINKVRGGNTPPGGNPPKAPAGSDGPPAKPPALELPKTETGPMLPGLPVPMMQ